MPDLTPADGEGELAAASGSGFDPGPRRHLLGDPLTRTLRSLDHDSAPVQGRAPFPAGHPWRPLNGLPAIMHLQVRLKSSAIRSMPPRNSALAKAAAPSTSGAASASRSNISIAISRPAPAIARAM